MSSGGSCCFAAGLGLLRAVVARARSTSVTCLLVYGLPEAIKERCGQYQLSLEVRLVGDASSDGSRTVLLASTPVLTGKGGQAFKVSGSFVRAECSIRAADASSPAVGAITTSSRAR